LANRLSANPNNRVLLIEAGPRFVILYVRLPVGAHTPQRYGRSFCSHSVPLYDTCTICCIMELYHGPSDWFGRAVDRVSSRTHPWWVDFDQYVGVTFGGHDYRLSIPQIIWFGPADQRATSIDWPKLLATRDGRGTLFCPR
jgi:hypothetical protein